MPLRFTTADLRAYPGRRPRPAPSLDLDFRSGVLDPRLTFTRASTATYVDANAMLQTAAIGEARVEDDPFVAGAVGLVIEPSSTNLITNSRTPETNQATRVIASEIATFAGYRMVKAIPTSESGTHTLDARFTASYAIGTAHSAQCVVKAGGWSSFRISAFSGGSTPVASAGFSFSGGDLVQDSGAAIPIARLADDVWLLKMENFTTVDGTTPNILRLAFTIAGVSTGIVGNDIDGVWFGGNQWEAGLPSCTSYMETDGAAASRAADMVSMPTDDWYSSSEGTLLVEAINYGNGNSDQTIAVIDNGGTNQADQMTLRVTANSNLVLTPRAEAVNLFTLFLGALTTARVPKFGFTYGPRGYSGVVDGGPVESLAGIVPSNLIKMRFGQRGSTSSGTSNMLLKRVRYYRHAMLPAQLQEMTA